MISDAVYEQVVAERDEAKEIAKDLVRRNAEANSRAEAAEDERDRLRAAVRAWDATLSDACDGPERDAVRGALGDDE